jgi:lysyl-tRNA synthetase, class II
MAVKKTEEIKVKMESSFIEMTGYHYGLKRLTVVFKKSTYVFYHVPQKIYQELLNSGSSGKYFNEQIRDKFNFEKK